MRIYFDFAAAAAANARQAHTPCMQISQRSNAQQAHTHAEIAARDWRISNDRNDRSRTVDRRPTTHSVLRDWRWAPHSLWAVCDMMLCCTTVRDARTRLRMAGDWVAYLWAPPWRSQSDAAAAVAETKTPGTLTHNGQHSKWTGHANTQYNERGQSLVLTWSSADARSPRRRPWESTAARRSAGRRPGSLSKICV